MRSLQIVFQLFCSEFVGIGLCAYFFHGYKTNVAEPMIASSTSQRQGWKCQVFLLSLSLGKEYTFKDLPLCPICQNWVL